MPAFRAGNVFNNTLGHVHVVVVAGEHGDILLTNWSSVRNPAMCDNSCILQAGDHPLIRHASYMFYAKSRVVTQQWLLERVYRDFGKLDQWQISDFTHTHFKEWKQPQGANKRIPISLSDILPEPNPELESLAADLTFLNSLS